MMEKIVDSFAQVDMSGIRCPIISVYRFPEDYPEHCVARLFDLNIPTNCLIVRKSIWEIEWDIRENTNLHVVIPRSPEDVASLVEVYM